MAQQLPDVGVPGDQPGRRVGGEPHPGDRPGEAVPLRHVQRDERVAVEVDRRPEGQVGERRNGHPDTSEGDCP
ncbi:hypothetical protein ABZ570_18980 [Micromonospora sp. NPDC007271]|uniref:hypothetical protein n=1 Tax=Micromonospora sp. NPDC007271 TaxID=3154587 RepID=UPI0033FF65B2